MDVFFHVGQSVFHGMHQWLSLALLLPFALHLWRNWGALLGYIRRRTLLVPLAATLLAAAFFAIPAALGRGGNEPPIRAALLLTQVPLSQLAPLLKTTPEGLQTTLRQRGDMVVSQTATLASVAESACKPAVRVLFDILPAN
ncbi:MAG: hypothetical protein ACJ8AW_46080 [Rhodopila sp.]